MPGLFKAEVYQNEFLPAGATEVHAVMTVTAAQGTAAALPRERIFGVICDTSGSMEGSKMDAAKNAILRLIEMLPPEYSFFVIAGTDGAQLVAPLMRADPHAKQQAMHAVRQLRAFGGTRMSNWLQLACEQFKHHPGALRQALLLTDGQNDAGDRTLLQSALNDLDGVFECDCRGVGTDWQVDQLRTIAERLLGSLDLIASPELIEGDFRAILEKAIAKRVSDVRLRLWMPSGAKVRFCKEVSPALVDLTARARELSPQMREYPTGAWADGEVRDFHFCIEVRPGGLGDEVLAGRVSLMQSSAGVDTKVAEARMLAVWTDDEAKSTKLNRVVAHYTGQADLAQSIHEGMEARAQGDIARATALLGNAVRIAHASGNEGTAKLLRRVVDVQDAERGTVRLKSSVALEDAMSLETRSTKTARIAKPA